MSDDNFYAGNARYAYEKLFVGNSCLYTEPLLVVTILYKLLWIDMKDFPENQLRYTIM